MLEFLLNTARGLDRIVRFIGRTGAWASVAMIAVILIDVILRRYFVIGSAKLQEMEWHLHGLLFLLALGYGYLAGAHVRIELIRERWGPKTKAWVELMGIFIFLLPFTLVAIFFGLDYTEMAYRNAEVSASLTGLGFRWIIKGAMVIGLLLLLFSGIAQAIRLILYLFGPEAMKPRLNIHSITDDTPHSV